MSITYPSSDSQGDQWLVARSLEFFFLLHSTVTSNHLTCFICHVKTVPASSVWAFSYITLLTSYDLSCGTEHGGVCIWLDTTIFYSSSLVIQNYFPTVLPSLHHVWSKVEAHLQRHLSPGIRRKYCYCFPNEPPSSSRLPTHISTNNHQCQSTLQQTKGNNPPASTISSTTHLLYSPESTAASLHALWDLKGAPNTSSQQHDP